MILMKKLALKAEKEKKRKKEKKKKDIHWKTNSIYLES